MFRRLGLHDDARDWYRRALPFAQNDQVRRFIEQRLTEGLAR
jgi:predicted RNA polymerase sigma factor